MDGIDHKDLSPEDVNARFEKIVSTLEAYYEQTLFLAAAAVYNRTGSLDHAAAVLLHSGFAPPPRYKANPNDQDFRVKALRRWLDENKDTILVEVADSRLAKYLSRGDLPWIY